MKYFYLSFRPRFFVHDTLQELSSKFRINPYACGSSPYNYHDVGYRVKTKEKFLKIKKWLKESFPEAKIVWTGDNNTWE